VNSEVRLREQAREHLESGKLPDMSPRRVWGGPGVGNECGVCDLAVTEDQSEMQVEFLRDHGAEVLQIFHFHLRCFAAWELERSGAASE
jgi:hypothetical protein